MAWASKAPDPARVFSICATLDGYDAALLQRISNSGAAAIVTGHYNLERMESASAPRGELRATRADAAGADPGCR